MQQFNSNDLQSDQIVDERPKVKFQTRQIALDRKDRKSYVDLSIKELIVYLVFVAFFITAFSDMYPYSTFIVNKEISALFIDSSFVTSDENDVLIKFDDIITMEDFWKYFYNLLCQKLYIIPDAVDEDSNLGKFLENKFFFRPRVRQVRIEEGHCKIRNQFKGLFQECYAPYDIRYEEKSSFGPKKGTPWTYSNDSETQAVFYDGQLAYYGAGGYYFDFPKKESDAITFIEDLEENTWLNRGTRAVFVDFTIYNGNINAISVAKLVFEFPASGGIVPSSLFRTIKLYRYAVADSLLTLFCVFVVLGFVVYYTVEEIFEIWYFRFDYFTIFWNIVDFSIVFLGWCSFGVCLAIASVEPVSNIESAVLAEGRRFFEYAADRHEILAQLIAFGLFLVCVKTVKYSDLNKPMTVIYLSLDRCFKTVAGYLVILSIVVSAFAVLGYCAFGAQIKGFATISNAYLSALKILMRDFDFETLQHVDETFTTFFFVLFTCIVIFILITMLLAIVFHAYFDVDIEELLSERKHYVCDKVSVFVDQVLVRVGFNKKAEKRKNKRLHNELGHITYQDIYKILKRCHITSSEIETILNRYGIEPQKTVHEDEARQIFKDLLKKPKPTNQEENTGTSNSGSDIEWLIKRVDLLENSIDEVHKKCDIVIARLDAIRVVLPPNYAELTEENSS